MGAQTASLKRHRWLPTAVLVAACVSGSALVAQSPDGSAGGSNVPEGARPLVVSIHSFESGRSLPQLGAGVIVAVETHLAHVATAAHVVVDADSVWVWFSDRPADSILATKTHESPDLNELDLAMITVPIDAARARYLASRLDRRGPSGVMRVSAPVSPVGCPDDDCWRAPAIPDRILVATPLEVQFQSAFVKRGSSGGALFNQWWEVVGIVTDSDPPRARAIPIDLVMNQVRAWGVEPGLRRSSFPRAGYKTTVGVTVLSSSREPADPFPPDGRSPSVRMTISREVVPGLQLHGGVLRLAPGSLGGQCPPPPVTPAAGDPNGVLTARSLRDRAPCEAALNGVVGGGSLVLQAGRFAARPFGEVVLGVTQGRFDRGGYYVTTDGTSSTYVPLYSVTEQQRLGAGGGLALDVAVIPRVILTVEGGFWRIENPFDGAALPAGFTAEFPAVYFGAGLRLGL